MLKTLLGNSPKTTIIGAVVAGLHAFQTASAHGFTKWYDVAITVAIAILGRLASDDKM